jgi:hypothetical protein
MPTIAQLVLAAEILTGLDVRVDYKESTYGENHYIGTLLYGTGSFCQIHNDDELRKELYRLINNASKKNLWLYRVREAVVRSGGKGWTEMFNAAVDEGGWDSQELADAATVPQATNVRVVDREDEDKGYW